MLWCRIDMQDLASSWIHQRCYRGVMVEEKGKQAEERQDEPRLWRPWRPPRRRMGWRVLWAVGMVVAVLTTGLLIVDLRPEIWKDLLEGRVLTLVALGFSLTAIVVMLAIAGARRSWTGFQGKTVWDFLQLLIVPLMLVAIGLVFSLQQDARQNSLEVDRARTERELAEQRAQDEALQAYLNQMSSLLLEKDLRTSKEDSEVRTLARARTLTVLERLDPDRKTAVLQFLIEAELVQSVEGGRGPIIALTSANLSDVNLSLVNLSGADLSEADLSNTNLFSADLRDANLFIADLKDANLHKADLRDAYLNTTDLRNAYLFSTDLSNTILNRARLSDAIMINANLSDASLYRADLSNTNLEGVDLSAVNLNNANLSDANLSGANLNDASGITNEELEQQAASLEGATMPDGQKYEDWLKDKESSKQNE
jgi:uncharacterized protein YjbI with pentapeptide repeats